MCEALAQLAYLNDCAHSDKLFRERTSDYNQHDTNVKVPAVPGSPCAGVARDNKHKHCEGWNRLLRAANGDGEKMGVELEIMGTFSTQRDEEHIRQVVEDVRHRRVVVVVGKKLKVVRDSNMKINEIR